MQEIASDTITESDKTRETTRLLLSRGENKSLDFIVMGSINTHISEKERKEKKEEEKSTVETKSVYI